MAPRWRLLTAAFLLAGSIVSAAACGGRATAAASAPDAKAPDAKAPDAKAPDAKAPDAIGPCPKVLAEAGAPDTGEPDATADVDASLPPGGTFLWAHGYGGTCLPSGDDAGSLDYDAGYYVDVDANGDLLVAGRFNGTIMFGATPALTGSGDSTSFLMKMGPSGNVIWSRAFHAYVRGLTHDQTSIYITLNFIGSITLGAQTFTSSGGADFAVVKLDAMGNVTGAKAFGGALNDVSDGLALGPGGAIAVVGGFYGTSDYGGGPLVSNGNEDAFVLELDASFHHLWSRSFGGASQLDDTPRAVAVDAAGNVVFGGKFGGKVDFGNGLATSAGDTDAVVACLDPVNGATKWAHTYGGSSSDAVSDLVVDPTGAVRAAGFGSGMLDAGANGGFVLALDAAGAYDWSFGYPAWASSIALGGSDDSLVVGLHNGRVLSLGPSHQQRWSAELQGAGFELWDVAVDASGSVYFTGGFPNQVKVATTPPSTLTPVSGYDVFVAKLAP